MGEGRCEMGDVRWEMGDVKRVHPTYTFHETRSSFALTSNISLSSAIPRTT